MALLPNKRWPVDFDRLPNVTTGFEVYTYDPATGKDGWNLLSELLAFATGGGGGGGGTAYTFSTGLNNSSGTITVNFTTSGGTNGTAVTAARGDHTHAGFLDENQNLSDLTSAVAARSNLGLGNIATLAGAVRGQIAYFGASGWALLAPSTAGYVLQTNGPSADPSWAAPSGGGGGTEYPTPVQISSTGAQAIALTGARTFVELVATSAATNATLPTGVLDKQRVLVAAPEGTQQHTLQLKINGAVRTLGAFSPHNGWSGEFLWDATANTWFALSMDGGLNVVDLPAASAIAGADKIEAQQNADGISRNVTLTQIIGLALATGGQFSAPVGVGVAALTDASVITTNGSVNKGNIFTLTTAAAGHSLSTPTGLPDGSYLYLITLGVAGGAPTFWSGIIWIGTGGNTTPPVFSTAAGATDAVTIIKSGTTFYGFFTKGT